MYKDENGTSPDGPRLSNLTGITGLTGMTKVYHMVHVTWRSGNRQYIVG